jgi:Fe2+ or Zn2+ uptake regulation protein
MQMDHPTAAEVYERVRRDVPQISLGTVYRNLGTMADEGSILRLSFAGKPDRFDPNTGEHYHVVCSQCGRIFDTDYCREPELLRRLDRAVELSTGVQVQQRFLSFSGICAQCAQGVRDTERASDAQRIPGAEHNTECALHDSGARRSHNARRATDGQ